MPDSKIKLKPTKEMLYPYIDFMFYLFFVIYIDVKLVVKEDDIGINDFIAFFMGNCAIDNPVVYDELCDFYNSIYCKSVNNSVNSGNNASCGSVSNNLSSIIKQIGTNQLVSGVGGRGGMGGRMIRGGRGRMSSRISRSSMRGVNNNYNGGTDKDAIAKSIEKVKCFFKRINVFNNNNKITPSPQSPQSPPPQSTINNPLFQQPGTSTVTTVTTVSTGAELATFNGLKDIFKDFNLERKETFTNELQEIAEKSVYESFEFYKLDILKDCFLQIKNANGLLGNDATYFSYDMKRIIKKNIKVRIEGFILNRYSYDDKEINSFIDNFIGFVYYNQHKSLNSRIDNNERYRQLYPNIIISTCFTAFRQLLKLKEEYIVKYLSIEGINHISGLYQMLQNITYNETPGAQYNLLGLPSAFIEAYNHILQVKKDNIENSNKEMTDLPAALYFVINTYIPTVMGTILNEVTNPDKEDFKLEVSLLISDFKSNYLRNNEKTLRHLGFFNLYFNNIAGLREMLMPRGYDSNGGIIEKDGDQEDGIDRYDFYPNDIMRKDTIESLTYLVNFCETDGVDFKPAIDMIQNRRAVIPQDLQEWINEFVVSIKEMMAKNYPEIKVIDVKEEKTGGRGVSGNGSGNGSNKNKIIKTYLPNLYKCNDNRLRKAFRIKGRGNTIYVMYKKIVINARKIEKK